MHKKQIIHRPLPLEQRKSRDVFRHVAVDSGNCWTLLTGWLAAWIYPESFGETVFGVRNSIRADSMTLQEASDSHFPSFRFTMQEASGSHWHRGDSEIKHHEQASPTKYTMAMLPCSGILLLQSSSTDASGSIARSGRSQVILIWAYKYCMIVRTYANIRRLSWW